MSVADPDSLKLCYEGIVKHNPNNVDAISYLGLWHLERHSFQQSRRFLAHLATLRPLDADVWMCLSICCSLGEDYKASAAALAQAKKTISSADEEVRAYFCQALLLEKQRDFTRAMEAYTVCLNHCKTISVASNEKDIPEVEKQQRISYLKEIRGEVMLRIAMLKKEMGSLEHSMQLCNTIIVEFSESIRANALCLKGLLHEMKSEFPASEVVYRSVLNIRPDHCTALERLGRVYLRYRETIPAAVQCFFKAVEINPSNHVAWYLLGRCYMATSQYSDACEAYNRSINLNPNDPQTWCSLGVLYYAFGQYKEALGMLARALKLNPTMADAWYNVGALYDMCDQPEDAQRAYEKAQQNGVNERFAKAGMVSNPFIPANTMQAPATRVTASTQMQHYNQHIGSPFQDQNHQQIQHLQQQMYQQQEYFQLQQQQQQQQQRRIQGENTFIPSGISHSNDPPQFQAIAPPEQSAALEYQMIRNIQSGKGQSDVDDSYSSDEDEDDDE